eukprot:g28773.t1
MSEPERFWNSDAAFAVINEAWFQILAAPGGGSTADLAAAPACGTPALLDLLTGVELSTGVLGAYTPTYRSSWEWDRLMRGVRELWGPSQVLRKAVVAVGRDNRSLLAHVALAKDGGSESSAALLMLLQAAAQLDRAGPEALLKRLPDGDLLAAMPEMQKLLSLVPPGRSRRPLEGVTTMEVSCEPVEGQVGQVLFDASVTPLPAGMLSPSKTLKEQGLTGENARLSFIYDTIKLYDAWVFLDALRSSYVANRATLEEVRTCLEATDG